MKKAMRHHHVRGAALLITLLTLCLMTIILVAFLSTMNWEVQASRRDYEEQKARAVATMGLDTAVGQLRAALGQWDAPYGLTGYLTNPPTSYWSVSPGIITTWSYSSVNAVTNYPLFSLPNGTTNLANLNAPITDGSYPLLGASTPLNVYWVNVLANPGSTSASSANPIIGRYAFWVDDENSKININTADGTHKTTPANAYQVSSSLGAGTPTEVSLQALYSGGVPLSQTAASNIVAIARTVGFSSTHEILRATGTAPDLYTNNVFNLTVMSRSPDLNIFGQPKIALIPSNYTNYPYTNAPQMSVNLATLQPLKELYPSQTGLVTQLGVLPNTPLVDRFFQMNTTTYLTKTNSYTTAKWPLAFMQPGFVVSFDFGNVYPYTATTGDNHPWDNGQVIANYLAGLNAIGKPITWPEFPGTTASATSYVGKYTPRQIDSITMQVMDLALKDTSIDMTVPHGTPAYYTRSSDSAFRGWLSGQLVNGIGRHPLLDKVAMEFTSHAANTGTNSPPYLNTAMYLELYMPSGFQGVSLYHRDVVYATSEIGTYDQTDVINCQDIGQMTRTGEATNLPAVGLPAALPKLPPGLLASYPSGNGPATTPNPPDGSTNCWSYWGNNLLRTDRGVDWQGNDPSIPDPDQYLAAKFHPYETNSAYPGLIMGSGVYPNIVTPILRVPYPIKTTGTGAINDWAPGEYRCAANNAGMVYSAPMSTNSAGGTINIMGGVAFIANSLAGLTTDMGDVPLDAMRGSEWPSGTSQPAIANLGDRTAEPFFGRLSPYTNVISAVIPMTAAGTTSTPLTVPPNNSLLSYTQWVYAAVQDPLVNKFPGDWNVTVSATAPTTTMQYGSSGTVNADGSTCAIYQESSTTQNGLTDPYSFYLPTIDSQAQLTNSIEPPQIPRSARFPSPGYLQYVRTGIIPDDETQPYVTQHGTPFRMMNFSPSGAASQAVHGVTYPDWAMLDLFYMPSSLLSYGSPYEVFAQPTLTSTLNSTSTLAPVKVTYANTAAVNNMFLYGTYGGATSGRINPNGSVMYTTNANIPTPGITRTVPLQALLHNLVVNPAQTGAYVTTSGTNDFHVPVYNSGTTVDETNIAADIANYLSTNQYGPGGTGPAPLREPAEICNVPTVAGMVASVNATRNDLVRQIVGNLTTQSNTFSVWVAGQSIIKTRGNVNYGIYEPGDQITANVRYHFIVERDFDAGTDGVYGSTSQPGNDNIVGTLDDKRLGTDNPSSPAYVYRIIHAEELR